MMIMEGVNREVKKRGIRLTACLLLGVMLFLQGCGGKDQEIQDSGPKEQPAGEDGAPAEEENQERSMGRYLEEEIILPDEIAVNNYPKMCLQRMESGELVILEQKAGMYLSDDQGESWSKKDTPWLSELQGAYVAHMAIAPNGSAAFVYSPPADGSGEADEGGYHPQYLYVDPEGNTTKLESPDRDQSIHQFWFGKDNTLYVYMMGGKVYEMDPESKEYRKLFENEGMSNYVCFTDSYMVISGSRGLTFYHTEEKMLVDHDPVLQDFLTEHVGDEVGANSDSYTVVLEEGEQADVICFACESGLYRHVIGGTAVEQIMEGNLSSLGDPKMNLAGMAVLPDNEFAILYTNGKLYRYTFDPDIPTIPEEQVSIYSLTENYAVRQAVSLFQKQHPEAYVRYEIGMNTENGMTSEDAIKNLNTRIMSGSGPDLLVLDGLPRRSYEEKGVLMDLSELVGDFGDENTLFPNIVESCTEDGKLWYLPLRFRLPLLAGEKEAIDGVTDLRTLADTMEALREANPKGTLSDFTTEEKTLRILGIVCSGAWTTKETGAIDEERLTDFLTQARRIFQAEAAGLSEEEMSTYEMRYENSLNWSGAMEYFADISSSGLSVAMGMQKMGAGVNSMVDGGFNLISTLANQEENFSYGIWQGQITGGFIPKGMIGISSGSKDSQLTRDFFRFLYGRELQDIEVSTGLPVNMASFESLRENKRPEDQSISIGTTGSDGEVFGLDIKWSGKEDFDALKRMAESVTAVCAGDAVIEEVVYEVGQKALNDSISVEEAVKEIVKKAAIYLAE